MRPCCPASPAPFAELLLTGAGWLLGLGVAWAILVASAALLEVATDGRVAMTVRLGCRGRLRRLLLVGAGTVLALGGPAAGTEAAPGRGDAPALAPPARPVGDLSAPGARPTHQQGGQHRSLLGGRLVVVRAGDSLWGLSAARHPGASPAALVGAVARTHQVNRSTIGADPDLIRPGQRLVLADLPAHRPSRPSCPRSELP